MMEASLKTALLGMLIAGVAIAALIWGVYALLGKKSVAPSSSQTPSSASPPPAPAAAATQRSWLSWLRWILVVAAVSGIGWWIWHEKPRSQKSAGAIVLPSPQKFLVAIDPLSFNREKSKGAKVVRDNGGYTIILSSPDQKVVYDFELPAKSSAPFLHLDFKLGFMESGYMGYRINDISHEHIFLSGGGPTRFIPGSQEFRAGKNELTFFPEEGQLRIDGNTKIVVCAK